MKVRNIAFFGVMASILSVGYANAADATVIASKAYADTKEATANKKALGSDTWSTIGDKDSDVKFPTMKVLNAAVGSIDVSSALTGVNNLTGTSNSNQSNAVTNVTQTNGVVTVTKGTLGTAAIASDAKESTSVVTGATAGKLATVGGVQADVQYMKGVGLTNRIANADATVISQNQEAAVNAWNATITAKKADDKVPTLAAVEARISGERAEIDSALSGKHPTIDSDHKLSSTLVSGLGTAATKNTTNSYSATGTDPITGTGVAAALGTLDSSATQADNKVLTGLTITDGKITAKTDTLIKNANVAAAGTANIDYGKMHNALYDINSASAATCSAANPCVLTYIGSNKFKWTNMDIDDLTVNTSVATNN